MWDPWIEREWDDLKQRVERSGKYFGEHAPRFSKLFRQQAHEFGAQDIPRTYPAFLDRVRDAARLAIVWNNQSSVEANQGDLVDEAIAESFPASDPPCWTAAAI